ncbi:MAG: hypothetical protein JWP35_396 [Caulobacter sp.]|nr:hypothetical protein [Caulobacter sp.]
MAYMSRPMKRYLGRLAPLMGAYLVILFFTVWTFHHHPPQGVLRYALAVAPALPLVGSIWMLARYVAEITDELERTIAVQGLLWAMGITLMATTVWGFLEDFAGFAHLPLWAIYPGFSVFYAMTEPFVRARYR